MYRKLSKFRYTEYKNHKLILKVLGYVAYVRVNISVLESKD